LTAAAAAVAAIAAGATEYAATGSATETLEAAAVAAVAVGVAALALGLPGVGWRGAVTGGFFVFAGMLSWTYMDSPLVVWALLAVEGLVFAALSWPWLRHLRTLPRLGTAWLGLAYWLLGIVGALLVWKPGVAAGRVAYAGVFGLAVLAVAAAARRDRAGRAADLTTGVAAAFLLAVAALLLSGAGNVVDASHVVPPTGWGKGFEYRFWGGPWLLYHPNSLALLGVLPAVRIGADRAFALWQRGAVTALAGLLVYLTNSRTGFLVFGAVAAVHALLLWRRRGTGLPAYRRPWLAAAAPFAVLALVLVASGGQGFLIQSRYGEGGVTSGRADTWRQVVVEWRADGPAEKLFGATDDVRATVRRPGSGDLKLTTDNAAVGALRRGGVLGVTAFAVGLALLVAHAWRRRAGQAPPAWFTVAVLGTLPAIATTDWLLGGTGGTLWVLLLAGEAHLLLAARSAAPEPAAEPSPV
jgi:hypothetical protein